MVRTLLFLIRNNRSQYAWILRSGISQMSYITCFQFFWTRNYLSCDFYCFFFIEIIYSNPMTQCCGPGHKTPSATIITNKWQRTRQVTTRKLFHAHGRTRTIGISDFHLCVCSNWFPTSHKHDGGIWTIPEWKHMRWNVGFGTFAALFSCFDIRSVIEHIQRYIVPLIAIAIAAIATSSKFWIVCSATVATERKSFIGLNNSIEIVNGLN